MARPKKLHPGITDERYVAAAKALYQEEGILEIGDSAQISHSKEGKRAGLGSRSVTLIANACLTVLRKCQDRTCQQTLGGYFGQKPPGAVGCYDQG